MVPWYTKDYENIFEELDTSPQGLSSEEVNQRLQKYGPNQLEERGLRNPWMVLLSQFTDVMVIVL